MSRERAVALGDELVRVHDALRADLERLRTGRVEPGRLLRAHCLAFCAALTRHHGAEDAGAFPRLAARFPELSPVLAKMAEDHLLVGEIVTRVEELARRPGGAPGPELDGLAAILESHFAFEERRIRAALDALDGPAEDVL